MQKKWILKEQVEAEKIEELATTVGISKPLAGLLLQRGIKDSESARKFFRPDLQQLYDPFLMTDMDKAVARLERAIVERENVLIYGDYDVDGTTAVAMMYVFLKSKCRNVFYYVPDRYTEGYGISYKGIDYAVETGCSLIIALDCGIKAVKKVEYAAERGIELIICDHHEPGDELPQAAAVLDPKRADCNYPFNELSGCGVGFKLIQAYATKHKIPFYQIKPFLDLVVVSIASDIVPIVDENRILAYFGLRQLNTNPRVGLRAVMLKSGITPPPLRGKDGMPIDVSIEESKTTGDPEFHPVKIGDIVFKIGPRINAAGRMDLGRYSVDLLVERNMAKAEEMACKIETDNTDRKTHDQNITNEALAVIDGSEELKHRKSTVLYNPEWHKGVIGIVASRLIDFYYRPTVICTKSNGFITGSARSIPGFNLYEAIEKCQDLLESFGGHTYAAGLTLKNYGTVLVSVADEDKEETVPLVRRFYEMGFNIEATTLTGEVLNSRGIRTKILGKPTEGSTEVLDSLRAGYVSYVINTRAILSGIHYGDGVMIRRAAQENNITTLTSLDTVRMLLDVLEEVTLGVSVINAE